MTAGHVTVLILSWNDSDALMRCLNSVHHVKYPHFDVLVVDNASEDGTISEVRSRYPGVTTIVNAENLGFGAGCNVGLEHVLGQGADFVFLLNQDTLVAPDILTKLVEFAQAHPRAGILGPKTYSTVPMADGTPRLLYTGSWRSYLPLRQRIPGINGPETGQYDVPKQVDYVWGHGMLVRTDLLRSIGLFDPRYFFYFEDLDLCERTTRSGYELWYVPAAVLLHDVADGARESESERWRWKYKADGIHRFYGKYYGAVAGPILTFLTVADMALRMALRGQSRAALDLATAYLPLHSSPSTKARDGQARRE